jgi:hypothetical protein
MSDTYSIYKNKSILLADLKIGNLPQTLKVGEDEFVVKPEFHITLLSSWGISKVIGSKNVELEPEAIEEFYKFVESFPLTRYKLSNELRFVNVNGNKTIVVMANLDGIDKLFDILSKKYGVKIPVQPTHVTLYTLPTDRIGIGINSYEELKKISEPIKIPELEKLL